MTMRQEGRLGEENDYDYDDDDDDDDSYDDYIKASFQLNNDYETSEGEEGCLKRMMMMMIAMHDE